jgi:hypothetical protein
MSSSGKTAIIRAALPGEHHTEHIDVRGRGRSTRTAATRALLNLLRQEPFRRRSAVHVHIELSIISTTLDQRANEDGSLTSWTV